MLSYLINKNICYLYCIYSRLTTSLNKPAPITIDQAVKFSTYLLSRRSVQIGKGASVLLEALQTIALDKKVAPISIQVIGNGQIQPEAPELNIKIVDLLGSAVTPAVSSVSAVVKKGTTVVVPKGNLTPRSSDKTVFSLNLSASKLARGSYVVEVTVDSLVQSLPIRLLGKVKVVSLEIGVGEADSTSNIKKNIVPFQQMLAEQLNADAQQKLSLRAELVDEYSGKPIVVHQAFVRLEHKASHEEIIFIAEQDLSKAYKFDLVSYNLVLDYSFYHHFAKKITKKLCSQCNFFRNIISKKYFFLFHIYTLQSLSHKVRIIARASIWFL